MNKYNLKDFSIAVIIYNPDEKVMYRLTKYNKLTTNLIIIDNSEQKHQYTDILINKYSMYINMHGNSGMSVALNTAFKIAISKKFSFLLTMDQDSEFSSDKIIRMMDYIRENDDENIGIYCPNYRRLYWNKKLKKYVPDDFAIAEDTIQDTIFSMTSGSFMRVSTLVDLLPLTDYFIGYVDTDICFSLMKRGYKIMRVGKISFDQSVGSRVYDNKYNRLFHVLNHRDIRYSYMIRNNLLLQKKYVSNPQFVKSLKLGILRLMFNILVGEKHKFKKFSSCIKGYILFKDNILGNINGEKNEK